MSYELIGVARETPSPLVIDSPHSWRSWPPDEPPSAAPWEVIATGWDAFVDQLWAGAVQGAAPVLAAKFHRSFIDANRARDDIDGDLLAGPWPGPLNPTGKSRKGMGLIRREALPGVPMYESKLPVQEVERRISRYYDPYHGALARLIDAAQASFGFACHFDCHSMKSVGNAMNDDNGQPRPDIVVSDLDGRTAAPALTHYVAERLGALGYHVQVNDPYQGAELIRRYSDPSRGRHSVQIEIKRGLYMDEARFEKNAGYERLAADLRSFAGQLLQDLHGELGDALRPQRN